MFDLLILVLLLLVLAVGGAAVFVGGADYFFALLLQRIVSWFQRVFLGIDKPRAGSETLIGQCAEVRSDFVLVPDSGTLEGTVVIQGELWKARLEDDQDVVSAGEIVEISGRDGLALLVRQQERA